MSYERPFGARTLQPAEIDRSDTERKLLSQFVLVVRSATPLNAACHLFDPRVPQTYATFITVISTVTVAKLHYLFTGH